MLDVQTRMAAVLTDVLRIDASPDDRLISDLGCDSLDLVALIMATEEEFHINIDTAEAEPFIRDGGSVETTVRDWTAFVERKLGEGV